MSTTVILLKTLQNLTSEEFETFKWFLQQPNEDFTVIPVCQLENANRMKTVDQMVQTYPDRSVEVTIKVLKMINRNDLLKELSKNASNPTAFSSQSSSGTNQLLEENKLSPVEKLKNARTKFIERTSDPNLNKLLDELLQSRVITDAEYEAARDKPRVDKARNLIDTVRNKGAEPSSKMINIFSHSDPFLCRELGLN